MVDYADADLAERRWHVCSRYVTGYRPGAGRGLGNSDVLSRLIMERALGRPVDAGCVVDHINGDRLDNRRDNLRECTQAGNLQNARARVMHGSLPVQSPFKGVSGAKGGKWRAYISAAGQRYIHLGTFDAPEEAARAYDAAAIEHFGEFARLNFPDAEPRP